MTMPDNLYDAFVDNKWDAASLAVRLVKAGVFFETEPWPDGQWRIAVKQDASHVMDEALIALGIESSGGHA